MTVTFLLWFWEVGFHHGGSPKDVGNTYSLLMSLKVGGGRRTTNKTQTKRENKRPQSSFRTSILAVEAGGGCGTRGRPRAQ